MRLESAGNGWGKLNSFMYLRRVVCPEGFATVAQLVEQLICNQQVVGSNPSGGSSTIVIMQCKGWHKHFVSAV